MIFELDTKSQLIKNDDYWKMCIGSCHAYTALREDYRQMLEQCKKEIGFNYIRFHGIFSDSMCVLKQSLTGEYILSFTNVDKIFDYLLSINMKPFIELGFMPSCLRSNNETIFHYKANVSPPKDEKIWIWLIESFVEHLINRYGLNEIRSWYFEVWNEPNLGKESGIKGGRFWSGSIDDYFRLYTITANAIKKIDTKIRVGGPATSNNALIPEMIEYCKKSNTPIDFITTHHYPTDVVLGYGVEDSQNFTKAFNSVDWDDKESLGKLINEYTTFQSHIWEKVDRGVLTDMAKRAKKEAQGLPLIYTEWSSLSGIESDGSFGASFILKTIQDNMGLVDGYSYWTFSDIFEEKGTPNCAFHGGFGLLTQDGIKKAPYNAFVLLNKLGDQKYISTFSQDTIDAYFFKNTFTNTIQALIINHQSLLHDIQPHNILLKLKGEKIISKADIYRLDDNHANALTCWKDMGCPQYLDTQQKYALMSASELKRQSIEVVNNAITITIPKQGAALVNFYIQ